MYPVEAKLCDTKYVAINVYAVDTGFAQTAGDTLKLTITSEAAREVLLEQTEFSYNTLQEAGD